MIWGLLIWIIVDEAIDFFDHKGRERRIYKQTSEDVNFNKWRGE